MTLVRALQRLGARIEGTGGTWSIPLHPIRSKLLDHFRSKGAFDPEDLAAYRRILSVARDAAAPDAVRELRAFRETTRLERFVVENSAMEVWAGVHGANRQPVLVVVWKADPNLGVAGVVGWLDPHKNPFSPLLCEPVSGWNRESGRESVKVLVADDGTSFIPFRIPDPVRLADVELLEPGEALEGPWGSELQREIPDTFPADVWPGCFFLAGRRPLLLPGLGGPQRERIPASLLKGWFVLPSDNSQPPPTAENPFLKKLRKVLAMSPGALKIGGGVLLALGLGLVVALAFRSGRGEMPELLPSVDSTSVAPPSPSRSCVNVPEVGCVDSTEVTIADWRQNGGEDAADSACNDSNCPVVGVTLDAARNFCQVQNARLPTMDDTRKLYPLMQQDSGHNHTAGRDLVVSVDLLVVGPSGLRGLYKNVAEIIDTNLATPGKLMEFGSWAGAGDGWEFAESDPGAYIGFRCIGK